MTYDEVKERITGLVTNPDKATEDAVGLLKDIEADYTTMDSLAEAHKTDEARIRELQDTNQKLFLSVTEQPKDIEDEEDNPIDWDALAEKGVTDV